MSQITRLQRKGNGWLSDMRESSKWTIVAAFFLILLVVSAVGSIELNIPKEISILNIFWVIPIYVSLGKVVVCQIGGY